MLSYITICNILNIWRRIFANSSTRTKVFLSSREQFLVGVVAAIFANALYCVLLRHIVELRVFVQTFAPGTFHKWALQFARFFCTWSQVAARLFSYFTGKKCSNRFGQTLITSPEGWRWLKMEAYIKGIRSDIHGANYCVVNCMVQVYQSIIQEIAWKQAFSQELRPLVELLLTVGFP